MPRLITKRHYILSLKKITSDFFQTDNQPTIGTNVHNLENDRIDLDPHPVIR